MNANEKRSMKIKWLRKLYSYAKNAELIAENEALAGKKNLEDLYNNPFDEDRFKQYPDVS
jgi:hypothetical protein